MSVTYNLKISPEQAKEMPMVDLAFLILKAANTPFYYRDLMNEIAKIKDISDNEVKEVIAQLYTEINIDGRFACVGSNLWGLKRWYPLDKSEDGIGNAQRPRIINDDDEDDEDLFEDEELDADYDSDDEEDEEVIDDEDEIDPDDELDEDEDEEAEIPDEDVIEEDEEEPEEDFDDTDKDFDEEDEDY